MHPPAAAGKEKNRTFPVFLFLNGIFCHCTEARQR
jgi:hypothetical protein